jgi:hypothetical protein
MEAVRIQQVITKEGELMIKDLPYKAGQHVEVIVLQVGQTLPRSHLTVRQFRQSGVMGLWQDRDDIKDSSVYARQLRDQAQTRGDIHHDFAQQ